VFFVSGWGAQHGLSVTTASLSCPFVQAESASQIVTFIVDVSAWLQVRASFGLSWPVLISNLPTISHSTKIYRLSLHPVRIHTHSSSQYVCFVLFPLNCCSTAQGYEGANSSHGKKGGAPARKFVTVPLHAVHQLRVCRMVGSWHFWPRC
jgi:hypothetical protein